MEDVVLNDLNVSAPGQDTATILKASVLEVPPLTPLRVSQFTNFSSDSTPGNVGIAISGGSSRSMIAGMGQLRGLKALKNAQGSLLEQTKAISVVSGGAWVATPFMYLHNSVSDDEFLGTYCEPFSYTVEGLEQLDEGNIGKRCTSHFSAKDLSLEAVLLIIAGVPHFMVWQILIGIHILKPYDLYSQSVGLPADFFSYNTTTLSNIVQSNPSLASKTCYLISTEKTRLTRPYFICNASMFVNVQGQKAQSLAPVHITPFFTGIFSTPPDARNINHQAVGGAGVTSFAFNSAPCAVNQQSAALRQSRQFSLADAAGTSSSFFAEYLQRQAAVWRDSIKHFFEDYKNKFDPKHWQHLIDNVPVTHGKIIKELLSKLQKLSLREDQIGNEHLLKENVEPGIFYDAFEKLASIIPQYHYWPANNSVLSSNASLDDAFADGGNLENTGISGLLIYEDIDNIISFINSSTPLAAAQYGILDASGQEIPDTRIMVDDQIPPLFGYQPYDDKVGYKLYTADPHPGQALLKHNRLFPSEAFAQLLKGLWQVSGNQDSPGSNQHAANYLQNLTTVENKWFNVRAGKNVNILWVYNNFINDWYEQLPDSVRKEVFNDDPASYCNFTHYSTLDTQPTPAQINLLASHASWSVCKASASEILKLYSKS